MESLTFVYASYLVGFFFVGAFGMKLLWDRIQLRSLLKSMEVDHECKR